MHRVTRAGDAHVLEDRVGALVRVEAARGNNVTRLRAQPYACATNAVNLQARGVDAGLVVLEPREHWRGVVRISAGG